MWLTLCNNISTTLHNAHITPPLQPLPLKHFFMKPVLRVLRWSDWTLWSLLDAGQRLIAEPSPRQLWHRHRPQMSYLGRGGNRPESGGHGLFQVNRWRGLRRFLTVIVAVQQVWRGKGTQLVKHVGLGDNPWVFHQLCGCRPPLGHDVEHLSN